MSAPAQPGVVVAHPGTQHALRLALALQRQGLLRAFVTNLYWDEARQPYRLIGRLPVLGPLARDKGRRRSLPDLDPSLVHDVSPLTDLILFALRTRPTRRLRERLLFAMARRFGARAALEARVREAALVAYDTSALLAFRQLADAPVMRLLDLSHPHVRGHAILRDEALRSPAWAPTSDAPASEEVIASCRAETLLADHVLVASSFSRRCLEEDGVDPRRISVVPYGVDLERFRPTLEGPRAGPLRLVFLGQVGQRKGVEYLLRAVAAFPATRVTLDVVGALIGPPEVFRGAPPNVTFHGRVREADLTGHLQRSHALVLPSLVEGFGLVLLEAMAAGLPIIATTHTAAPDLVREGREGFVVPPRSVEALQAAIAALADDPARRVYMGQAARALAERHPWSRYEAEVVTVVRAACTAGRSAPAGR